MTSTNDGKDVKSNQTSGHKGKSFYIELYKSLEARLSSEGSLSTRTGHVCDAWRRVYSLYQNSTSSTHPHLLTWLQRHTALIVLQTEWQAPASKDEHTKLGAAIDALITETQTAIANRDAPLPWEQNLLQRAQWFRKALSDPWGHPVLKSLLNPTGEPITDDQVLEWLKDERGVVFISRLRQLAASRKCEDLALTLATAVMDRARSTLVVVADDDLADEKAEPEEDSSSFCAVLKHEAGFASDIWEILTDIEFVLLHKQNKRARCIELAKQTPLRNGYQLVERLRSRPETSPRDKKLWKNAKEVATLIAQVVIARCMVLPSCAGAGRAALYCCARSLARLLPPARLAAVTAALAAPAATARHLHTLCAAINAQVAGDMKPFVCELYVRAITAGMNELERLKLNADKQAEARSAEQTLASWFMQLGTLLTDSARLRAECALTAFSVHPAPNMFERVRQTPAPPPIHTDPQDQKLESTSEFGSWANDSRSQSNLVKTSETLQLTKTQHQANVLSTAILTEGETLGLSTELGQDLAVLLSGPRVKTLSWDTDREVLLENCRAYMERTHGGTRAVTTELKYLNLDPKAFQHLPEEEDDDENDAYYGIEKGYEHLVQLEEPEEIWQNAFFDPEATESAHESETENYQFDSKRRTKGNASSEEDSDPLSLFADAKKEKKKQANKEKSKEHRRKKTHKRDSSKEKDASKERRKEKDKKPKKERKKKSDQPVTGSLTSLLGMKVTKMSSNVQDGEKRVRKKKERRRDETASVVSVTDSDYDSQGKLSQVSDNNEPQVVFDGLFSMDELKSPERRTSDDSQKTPISTDLSLSDNIVNFPSTLLSKPKDDTKPKLPSKRPSTPSDDSNRARSPYLTPNQLKNRHVVCSKVKNSITKLLQFRRKKAMAPKLPPASSAPKSDSGVSTMPNQSLVGMKVVNSGDINKDIKTYSSMPRTPSNETTKEFDKKSTSPHNAYNVPNNLDMRYYNQQYNFIHSVVQNPNMFSENQRAHSDYNLSSPQKQYSYTANQHSRPTSVIDTNYLSPPKQPERTYGHNVAPQAHSNKLNHQTFHRSMQNLNHSNNSKFDQPINQGLDMNYYSQYYGMNNQQISPRSHSNTSLQSASQPVSHAANYSNDSYAQEYDVSKAKRTEEFVKYYRMHPKTDSNIINQPRQEREEDQYKQTGSDPHREVGGQKQLTSSLQNILQDALGTVTKDIAKALPSPNKLPMAHTSHVKSYSMNSHTKEANVPRNLNINDNKPLSQRDRPSQDINPKKPSNTAKDTTEKQQPSKAGHQNNFEEFLKELQKTINAGVSSGGKPQSIPLNNQVKVTINPPPMSTPAKKSESPPQSAKTIQQKKTDNAPNTFSRLSYMHKNKQIETKVKNDAITLELNKSILEHKLNKARQIKNEVTISRVDKRNPVKGMTNAPALFSRNDKPTGNLQKKCPLLSSMLDSKPLEATNRRFEASVSNNVSNNSVTDTISREHADLLLLLRNQQTLTVPQVRPTKTDVAPSNHLVSNTQISNLLTNNTQIRVETPVPVKHQRTLDKEFPTSISNTINSVDSTIQTSQQNIQPTKESEKQDWESVMNAILAHKTQPLGPNALDMVLKKDNKRHSHSNSLPSSQKAKPLNTSSSQNKPDAKKREGQNSRSSSVHKPSIEKHPEAQKRSSQTSVIKKISPSEMSKKTDGPSKHFTSNPPKRDDPFISGIHNSDYDLRTIDEFEELMDDDLRQEIGELLSDEESYKNLAVSMAKAKGSCNANTNAKTCNKQAVTEKSHTVDPKTTVITCKNAKMQKEDSICSRTTPVSFSKAGFSNVISHHPDLTDAKKQSEPRPSVVCPTVETQATPIVPTSQSVANHFIANITPRNVVEPLIITSIPAQPVVVISQELVYDPFPTIRIHESPVNAGLCSMVPNTYVALNTAPNIAVYQTTQFAAPVINPVIIGNATTTTNMTVTESAKTNFSTQEVNSNVTKTDAAKQELNATVTKPVVEKSMETVNKIPDITKERLMPTLQNYTTAVGGAQFKDDVTETKSTNVDFNMNTNSERKVLSQMQENHTNDNIERVARMKRLSTDKQKSDKDEERIKMKRHSLINRKISHPCIHHPPIPLTYSPINKKSKLIQGTPINGTIKSNFEFKSNAAVVHKDASSNESGKIESNNENLDGTDQSLSTKENQGACRRILLRSSNKLESKTKVTVPKIVRAPLRRNGFKVKPSEGDHTCVQENKDDIEASNKHPTRISTRVQKKSQKIVEVSAAGVASSLEANSAPEITESITEKINPNIELIDFENELSGSKIEKTSFVETATDEVKQNLRKESNTKNSEKVELQNDNAQEENDKQCSISNDTEVTSESPLTSKGSVEPLSIVEKLKNNLGNELIIKSSSDSKITKNPIFEPCEIVNQNTLSKKAANKRIVQANKKITKKVIVKRKIIVKKCDDLNLKTLKPSDSVSEKINTPKPSAAQNNAQKLDANHSGEILPHIQEKLDKNYVTENGPNNTNKIEQRRLVDDKTLPLPVTINKEVLPKELPKQHDESLLTPNAKLRTIEQKEVQNCSNQIPYSSALNTELQVLDKKNDPKIDDSLTKENQVVENLDVSKSLVSHETAKETNGEQVKNNKPTEPNQKPKEPTVELPNLQGNNNPMPEKTNASQFRKEDVVIEEIPIPDNNDATKKCVRVKLPNGKVFKATVYGKMQIDYDTLFAEPAIRAVLTDSLGDGKRYTLNIKQVSKAIKNNPGKIVDTQIREINIKEKELVPIDTVNLISDDEDEETTTSFDTEFGKYATKIDQETFIKHQKRFAQKCVVKLCKQDLFKSNRTKPKSKTLPTVANSLLTRNRSKMIAENNTAVNPEIKENLPPVNVNSCTQQPELPVPLIPENITTHEVATIPEVIEIDDSSNDSVDVVMPSIDSSTILEPVQKITELKDLLLQDLGVVDKINKCEEALVDEIPVVEDLKNALLEDLGVLEVAKNLSTVGQTTENKLTSTEDGIDIVKTQTQSVYKNCVVKIAKCEDLIKKYELLKKAKECFVLLKRCDASLQNNQSLLKSVNVVDSEKTVEADVDFSDDFIDFDDDASDSPKLSRCPSLSILNNLWNDANEVTAEDLYGRSSPVMEVFEMIVSLRNKRKDNLKVYDIEPMPLTCYSEWIVTKRQLSEDTREKKDFPHVSQSRRHEYSLAIKNHVLDRKEHSLQTLKIPTLVGIALKSLKDNPQILNQSPSFCYTEHRTLKTSPSNNLKRKTVQTAQNDVAHKIPRLGTLAINVINTCRELPTFKTEINMTVAHQTLPRIEEHKITVNDITEYSSKFYGGIKIVSTEINEGITNDQAPEIDDCEVISEDITEVTEGIVKRDVESAFVTEGTNCSTEISSADELPKHDETENVPGSPNCGLKLEMNPIIYTNTNFDIQTEDTKKEIVKDRPDELLTEKHSEDNNTDKYAYRDEDPADVATLGTSLKDDKLLNPDSLSVNHDTNNTANEEPTIVADEKISADINITENNESYCSREQWVSSVSTLNNSDTTNMDEGTCLPAHDMENNNSIEDQKAEVPNLQNDDTGFDSQVKNDINICNNKSSCKNFEESYTIESADKTEPILAALDTQNNELETAHAVKIESVSAHSLEIPPDDIPSEACEVEILDKSNEDQGNVVLISNDLKSSDPVVNSELSGIDMIDSKLTSPPFVDNKEIVFNYHDYTKPPKIKPVTHTKENTINSTKNTDSHLEIKSVISKEETENNVTLPAKAKPSCKYEFIQEEDLLTVITTETDADASTATETEVLSEEPESVVENVDVKSESLLEEIGNSGVILKGIEYEDPVIGTCYVFSLNESGSSASNVSSDSIEAGQDNWEVNKLSHADSYEKLHDIEFCLITPKVTYSKKCLKRKMNSCDKVIDKRQKKAKSNDGDSKTVERKYRKSKNIDCPKQTVTSMMERAYSREYKRLLEYCSSIKFSYSRPFHKEYVDVSDMVCNWPLTKMYDNVPEDIIDQNLFIDLDKSPIYQPDPSRQTLIEEIAYKYETSDDLPKNSSCEAHDTNFNMGFGEGSGRVIQNLKKKEGDSNISAATLSDVKQSQPFLTSEDYNEVLKANKDDQIKKIRQYINFIELRDKVRSFFKKTSVELKFGLMQHKVDDYIKFKSNEKLVTDLCSLDYVQPPPTETIIQVVQVGQLPVSAAAQNPVTCDPRVTQVSDASPSQCSVDNSPNDDSQSEIKTEYTELTTADLTLPLVQEYAHQNQAMNLDSNNADNIELTEQTISLEMEIKAEERLEIKEEIQEIKEEVSNSVDNSDLHTLSNATSEHVEYSFENNTSKSDTSKVYESSEQNNCDVFSQQRQQNGTAEKTDQIAHAMNAAGITTTPESLTNSRAHALVNILSQKIRQGSVNTTQTTTNTYSKTTSINAMALQQALAQILPPPLNQTGNGENNQSSSTPVGPQVLHIVQGKNASGNQITLVDNSQQSVISGPNATQVLHIVQNKGAAAGQASNGTLAPQSNSFSGLSLVDAGLQQGGNQLLHIVNTGNQKNSNPSQLLKRVNLLTNLANVQGSNEQKMVQFVCKSADGKAIQLNAPHQRSMVLRLQPIEPTQPVQTPPAKPAESQELSPSPTSSTSSKESANQQEIKSRSIYEENYAKFIQNSSSKTTPNTEKSTSLPKFNQAFGKPVFQEGNQKQAEVTNSNSHMPPANTNNENSECPATENAMNLEHISQISSPPLLLRKQPAVTSQSQSNLVQQIKQTIAPMNIQTMHGGVIYTRQIPVNIGGGQTINLITVPSTELMNDEAPKPQTTNQSEIEPSIIKIVPQAQNNSSSESSQEDNNSHASSSNENAQNPQPQPVLTQMRIKLPMLSKAPQMVPGARVVRPSFFQIQRNVIGGANQPVYQQLVLTAAPPLGQQTIRLPQAQASRPIKVPSDSQSSSDTSQMSSSTLEQLREFDMVLEQVKERSTVQPTTSTNNSPFKIHNASSDTTDGTGSSNCSNESTQQVLYSIGNSQSLSVAYVNRKATVTTPTTSTYVRSPDSSSIGDSPTSSTHVQIPHTVTTDSSPTEMSSQPKPAKIGSKSKSRPKSSSNPPNTLKLNSVPPKTSSQKPLEDEQTTQRILYILAEYKEQVENSPDKDKPAPRRRSNPPSNPGSSKRKKSSSSRRSGTRDMSPVHGEDTCRTMGSEDSSCGTSQGDCTESCLDSHSPQDSPRKVARKITFDQEMPATQPRPQPQRNVIVADGQTITVARGTTGKPATAVLMPANYILPVSMVKGGQQIAIVTNRGPKLLTVGGEAGAANALLLQRLIGPGGLKPVLARPGVRHVRLPTAALHNLQAFNLATATSVQPPDSTASPTPGPTPPELVDTRATSSPWTDREDVKPERGSSPEGSEPWNLPSSADAHEYTYEETVRTDNMDRTVLDPIPDRYSPDMEAQRIFDKMFDVDSKKSYAVDSHDDSPRCAYDIDASDCDDKAYQVVQKKDGTQRQHRLSHVSAAALRHKYAILEHELRLQKSLSEECEDLGVDSPSASELFPEAELLFATSPAHEHNQEQHRPHTPQPHQSTIPQPDMDDQIATDHLIPREIDVNLGLGDVGIVTVSDDGMQTTIALDQEEFARSHPNTTFHSEPTEGEVQPFTITGLKGRHITSTIFHSNSAPATVLMAAPQATVISQAPDHSVKYEIENMINSMPSSHNNDVNLSSVLVKDEGLTRFDSILTDSRELHLTNTASAIVHSSGNATQVIRRVCYEDDKRERDTRFLIDEPENIIAGDDAKMIAEDSSRDATLESMADVDDDRSSPERHAELFWESNSASERSESRRPLDFSSDSDKCCKSPSFDETNSTDSSGVGTHMRLDSVIKEARGRERSGSAGSSADDTPPPLRTYPPKRLYHPLEGEVERSLSGKTRAGERSPDSLEVRRRASGRGVVKRGCHCCNGSPAPARPKKPRQRKPTLDFNTNN